MTQHRGTAGHESVRSAPPSADSVPGLEAAEDALVRLAAAIAAAGEHRVRLALTDALHRAPAEWTEEVILQSYLFAGFPRALNAAREWRRISGREAPAHDAGERYADADRWRVEGERTCAVVYGAAYAPLRHNIRALHPALDAWMIVEGYGKVLSRAQLDLRRRELCIVAACAAAGQDRQLHAHLHGARNAGASGEQLSAVLNAVHDVMRDVGSADADTVGSADATPAGQAARFHLLLERVLQRDVH
jgi:4-carboxymuconolactone decarboxylase